jgi:hypothetical protein
MGALDGFRNLFNIRKDRRRPPPGAKPRLGAKIYLHDVRMSVQSGLSDELWKWLQELGFREITFSPDRRRYRDLPPSLVARLYDSKPDDWRPLLKQAIREAKYRGPATGRTARPAKVSA